jgi:hypothetical protein
LRHRHWILVAIAALVIAVVAFLWPKRIHGEAPRPQAYYQS